MKLLRKIFFPFVPIYYLVTLLRNYFYDKGWFASKSYKFPVICVGNLSVGGTGKTPMIEFLVKHLKREYKLAILSRGYKRKTKGFVLASNSSTVNDLGDEPFQFYSKYKDIKVAVDANRQNGIKMLHQQCNPDVILLDDAYQHRKVKPGFTILLTTYNNPYYNDCMLPTGDLREPKKGAKRADIIVVTKCPEHLSEKEKNAIVALIKPKSYQKVFFSFISYSKMLYAKNDDKVSINSLKDKTFTLVTGIANSKPLVDYLTNLGLNFEHLNYSDHHDFTNAELKLINSKNIILTTEKDFMRLSSYITTSLYYLPIDVKLDDETRFIELLNTFLKQF